MVYGIVSRHGGEILVNTAEGAGSTFTIRLPTGRTAPEPGAAGAGRRAPSRCGCSLSTTSRSSATRWERSSASSTTTSSWPTTALGAGPLPRETFDLVMTDLAMPGMSGWQVAQAVKAARPQVPVVLVTGWASRSSRTSCRRHGVDRVMTKPFRFEDVQDSRRELPGIRRSRLGEGGLMTSPVIVEAIRTLVERRDLTRLEAAAAMEALMSGAATSVQVAAFLTALG